jgi:hypothetical protein
MRRVWLLTQCGCGRLRCRQRGQLGGDAGGAAAGEQLGVHVVVRGLRERDLQ